MRLIKRTGAGSRMSNGYYWVLEEQSINVISKLVSSKQTAITHENPAIRSLIVALLFWTLSAAWLVSNRCSHGPTGFSVTVFGGVDFLVPPNPTPGAI